MALRCVRITSLRRKSLLVLIAYGTAILCVVHGITKSTNVSMRPRAQNAALIRRYATESYPIPEIRPITPHLSSKSILNLDLFNQAQNCIADSPFAPSESRLFTKVSPQLPVDLEDHYLEMLAVTAVFRDVQWSYYANYSGPWMENVFISDFCCDRPLSDFGGLVPLFVQWTDLWHLNREEWLLTKEARYFLSKLRKDIIYVTISQHDEGLFHSSRYWSPRDAWNILVLSGGGYGHAALPIFGKELMPLPINRNPVHVFAFAGVAYYNARQKTIDAMNWASAHFPEFSNAVYYGPDWVEVMRSARLNFAPRGFGRSSFRLAELVQMGLVPVFVWDDHDWTPYKGSSAHISNFGWSVQVNELHSFIEMVIKGLRTDPDFLKLNEKRQNMAKVRNSHYTLGGLRERLRLFFQADPRSDIVCQRHPFAEREGY